MEVGGPNLGLRRSEPKLAPIFFGFERIPNKSPEHEGVFVTIIKRLGTLVE